jgi:hypothetical protein
LLESGITTLSSFTGGVVKMALVSVIGVSKTGILSATEPAWVESATVGVLELFALQDAIERIRNVVRAGRNIYLDLIVS